MRRHIPIFFLLIFSFAHPAFTQEYFDGIIFLKTKNDVPLVENNEWKESFRTLHETYGITSLQKAFRLQEENLKHIYRLTFSQHKQATELLEHLHSLHYIEYAERLPRYKTCYIPNDLHANQWHLEKISAPLAWDSTRGNPDVIIAIVDNGVNIHHLDLKENIWVNPGEIPGNGIDDDGNGYIDDVHGYDVADQDADPAPPPGTNNFSPFRHGTHVAGIASAVSDNGTGIASLGFSTALMAVKCSPDTSNGEDLSYIYEGIEYSIAAGADVINMSFGSTVYSSTLEELLNTAHKRGLVSVAAAGNDTSDTPFYPAAYQNVIAVGATNQNDIKSSFSNYGNWVDVMAPGNSIYSTLPALNNTYGSLSGTSMACPLVSALAALILSRNYFLDADKVKKYIREGCDDIYPLNPSFEGKLGTGRINAHKTVQAVPLWNLPDTEQTLLIYPNPSHGAFKIYLNEANYGDITVKLINMAGQVVYTTQHPKPKDILLLEINLSDNIPRGIYVLAVTQNRKMQMKKIVVY